MTHKFKLKNPVNLEIKDARALYLLWHMFNNCRAVFASGYEAPKDTGINAAEVAYWFHESYESSEIWRQIDDLCKQQGMDASGPLRECKPLPAMIVDGFECSVEVGDGCLRVGCKRVNWSDVKKLFIALSEAGYLKDEA